MSDFTLFEQAQQQYKKITPPGQDNISQENQSSCEHDNVVTEKSITICVDCGEEIQTKITHNKEWRYYGNSDNKHSSDPNRVQVRKTEERNIFKDVENLGFSEKIIAKANKIYADVTKDSIYRGNFRKAIVFACVFHAYKLCGKPQGHDSLIEIFKIKKRTGLRGLKYVNLNTPKDSEIRTTYITPINLMDEIMEKFDASKEQKKEVINIYNKIKNKSSRLNRSRPQSVASGIVYYWIKAKNKDISIQDFCKRVPLSELTVSNISKEIAKVLNTPEVI